jgi:hypothetical protein
MAITHTSFHTFRIVTQLMDNLVGMQANLRRNAQRWAAMATAQSPDIATLATYMHDGATTCQTRLSWILTYKNTSPNWPAVTAMFAALGGNIAEATTLYAQLKAVADQLANASITSYAQATTACNSILANVQAPDTLWSE